MKKIFSVMIMVLIVASFVSCDSIGEQLESFSDDVMSQVVDAMGDVFKDAGDTESTPNGSTDTESTETDNAKDGTDSQMSAQMPDDFSFSITWGTFGRSSYDSTTGRLLKDKYATNIDDYTATYIMSEQELEEIYGFIYNLKPESYDDEFDSSAFAPSDPHLTLILTIHAGDIDKTIKASAVSVFYDSANTEAAQRYLDTISAIKDIITSTDEWKALPDYEIYFE